MISGLVKLFAIINIHKHDDNTTIHIFLFLFHSFNLLIVICATLHDSRNRI